VWNTPGNFYSEKYKHVIGPEFVWTYRTRVEDFLTFPFFDYDDRVPGTNQLFYGLVQRFYSKRAGRSGKLEPYEFMRWSFGQTYYLDTAASLFDPSYQSTPYDPEGNPSHYSPIASRFRFSPTPRLNANFDFEYDVNFDQLRSFSLSAAGNFDRIGLRGSWFRANNLVIFQENRTVSRDTVRGGVRLGLLPRRLNLEGAVDYDFIEDKLLQASGRLRYDVQCCGFQVELIRVNYYVPETRFTFSVDLANIGSIGNFMGQGTDPNRMRGLP
jgi:lipopolysaccharide assembly outer membrane protein LptD (OstA)